MKIVGKIDLEQFKERPKFHPERYKEDLDNIMGEMSQEINEEFGEFLNPDGSIIMDSDYDKDIVEQKEQAFANDRNLSVDEWREKRDKNPANITEMAVTAVLHKALKERFIITRASAYDDYENGVDNIIIDKQTGAVVCGFDEVIKGEFDVDSNKKDKKILAKAKKGGARIKYGVTIEDNKLVKKELRNVPAFYLSLDKKELNDILINIKNDNLSQSELNIFSKLVNSLEDQIKNVEEVVQDQNLIKNINIFKESLEVIKELE